MKISLDHGFQQFLELNNINFADILEEAQVPNLLWKEELNLEEDQYFRLQEVLAKHLSDEQILLLSDISKIQLFMPAFFASLAASNGLQALHRFAKYKQIVGPIKIDVVEDEDKVYVELAPQSMRYNFSYFSVANELSLILSILRTGSAQKIVPVKITEPFELGEAILDNFGAKVQKSETVSLTFNLSDLEVPFLTRNNTMWQLIEPELERQLRDIKTQKQFINIVHKELQRLVAAGEATLDNLAQRLGVSSRTLQRQLKEEQTTFKAELQTIQFNMAVLFAKKEGQNLEEISYLVGYSEPSAFSRAVKKWSGKTFKQYMEGKDI